MLQGRELEAAAVAARLRSFQQDPMRAGMRIADGREPLPDGGIVLRFAQGKIPASLATSDAQADELRSAARYFVSRVCLADHADHYQVLCASRDAPLETLKDNYHLLMALLHPDRQEGAAEPWPQSCAQRVNLAYATLGEETSRRDYDIRLRKQPPRARIAPSGVPARSARTRDVRFAKSLIVVSITLAVVVGGALLIQDENPDSSILQSTFARLRLDPSHATSRPRYVGASAAGAQQRLNDATASDESPALEIFKPLMRAFASEEPKAYVPPKAAPTVADAPASLSREAMPQELVAPAAARPVAVSTTVPIVVAQASVPVPQPVVPPPAEGRPSNSEVEDLVVALISYYGAGDADGMMGLIDRDSIGFFRRNSLRQTYSDFFRDTRARKLRIDNLAWTTSPGAASARGAATVTAEYQDRAPMEKSVDVQIDIVLRDGKARVARLNLFPQTP